MNNYYGLIRERHKEAIKLEEEIIDNYLDRLIPLYRKKDGIFLGKIEMSNLSYEIMYNELLLKDSLKNLEESEKKIFDLDNSLIDSFYNFDED